MSMYEQISFFEEFNAEHPPECCYQCEHFAEFKQSRTYTNRDGEFCVYGMCFKSFCKNGSYNVYPIYVAKGKCKDFKRIKKGNTST